MISAIYNKGVEKLDEAFVGSIPSDEIKSLHSKYSYPLGFVLQLMLYAIFGLFFINGILEGSKEVYLAPASYTAPEKQSYDSRYCDQVPISSSGYFSADLFGNWQGSNIFNYGDAIYTLFLTNYQSTKSFPFSALMNDLFLANLEKVAQGATSRNLAMNLLYWMTWFVKTSDSDVGSQRFYMTGEPLTVFDREKQYTMMAGVDGVCQVNSKTLFNNVNGQFSVHFSYQNLMNDPVCSKILSNETASLMGYFPYTDDDDFQIRFNIQTLITALAVNLGINELSSYSKVRGLGVSYNNQDITYYIDPRYPSMEPLLCATIQGKSYCVLTIGSVNVMPLFNHIGVSLDYPYACDCTANNKWQHDSPTAPCNLFSFLTGFIFWNAEPTSPAPIFELMNSYANVGGQQAYEYINYMMYYNQYASSPFGEGWINSANDSALFQNLFYFCTTASAGSCSIVTTLSMDISSGSRDWTVSKYYHQLQYGACNDTFTMSSDNWQNLIDIPFAPLYNEYVTCLPNTQQTILNAAGVASGNAGMVTPFAVLLVIAAFNLYAHFSGVKVEYPEKEKQEALEGLAELLVAEKHRLNADDPSNGDTKPILATRLVQEMESNENGERFTCDPKDERKYSFEMTNGYCTI